MSSIVYVGMDVHKESFTVCCYSLDTDRIQYQQKFVADYKMVLKYIEGIRKYFPENTEYICGYEAGCLGYTLYHQLSNRGVKCIILAPTTMAVTNTNRVKTDRKDAGNIARCLAFHTYSEVYIPSDEDNAVKEYIRMRDDQKKMLKSTKQQILAMVLRQGKHFDGGKTYWTIAHVKWLKSLQLDGVFKEVLEEYLITYTYLVEKIERLDSRIEELSSDERYKEKVKKLSCLIGVKTHTALSVVVEVGDFDRFAKAEKFASFLGLVPSEDSSGDKQNRYGITKAGNSHLRRLLVEAAQGYTRGAVGNKSLPLKQRQKGNSPQIIAYADKANERLRRRFYKMTLSKGINRNVATTAIARELACFMWGMMTDNVA
jgi:Transposase and inactivated derivatives